MIQYGAYETECCTEHMDNRRIIFVWLSDESQGSFVKCGSEAGGAQIFNGCATDSWSGVSQVRLSHFRTAVPLLEIASAAMLTVNFVIQCLNVVGYEEGYLHHGDASAS